VQIGKLYSILPVDSCVHGVNGGPALFNALGIGRDGAYADYIIVTADTLVPVVRLLFRVIVWVSDGNGRML
jgi:hypothetical protein